MARCKSCRTIRNPKLAFVGRVGEGDWKELKRDWARREPKRLELCQIGSKQ